MENTTLEDKEIFLLISYAVLTFVIGIAALVSPIILLMWAFKQIFL